jgi:hypothetical protein
MTLRVLDNPARNGSSQSRSTLDWADTYGHNWFVDTTREITVASLSNTTPAGTISEFALDWLVATADHRAVGQAVRV